MYPAHLLICSFKTNKIYRKVGSTVATCKSGRTEIEECVSTLCDRPWWLIALRVSLNSTWPPLHRGAPTLLHSCLRHAKLALLQVQLCMLQAKMAIINVTALLAVVLVAFMCALQANGAPSPGDRILKRT